MESQDPLYQALEAANRQVAQANQALEEKVQEARAAGLTWQTIGQALGVSKQAAAQRFAQTLPTRRSLDLLQTELNQITDAFFAALARGIIEDAQAYMTYTASRRYSKRKLLKTWQEVTDQVGPFTEVSKTLIEEAPSGFILSYRLTHAQGQPVGQISFNPARKITGLVIFNDDTAPLPW